MLMRLLSLFILLLLPISLSGCGEKDQKYGGIGYTMVSEYSKEFYVKVWSNEYPESGDAGLEGRFGVYEDPRLHYNNSVFYCADGDRNYREKGNYLDTVWLKVIVYELRETLDSGPQPGEKWEENRWDGLKCFEGYTVLLDEQRELSLYHCALCTTPEDREGEEPWPASSEE